MRRFNLFRHFVQLEASSGWLLGIATLLALWLSNSPLRSYYQAWLDTKFYLGPAAWHWHLSLTHLVNDGLMAIFFFLVSLEIKRELKEGQLNSLTKALLPMIAALGGIVVPAIFYFAFNRGQPNYWGGWAIPTATDIAFALGVLSLLGARIPTALNVFLTALAIIDDLIAIIIIAIFYTPSVNNLFLALAGVTLLLLIVLNHLAVNRFYPYAMIGLLLWFCVLKSGLHTTLAGVLLGFTIPLHPQGNTQSLVHRVERRLHPWVAYAILPIFALVNAGLSLTEISRGHLLNPLFWGVFTGLFLGKPLGIFTASWIVIKMGIVKWPPGVQCCQLYGVAVVCGIGFTMSLFIGTLAFVDSQSIALVRLGVFVASLLSGTVGYFLLAGSAKRQPA